MGKRIPFRNRVLSSWTASGWCASCWRERPHLVETELCSGHRWTRSECSAGSVLSIHFLAGFGHRGETIRHAREQQPAHHVDRRPDGGKPHGWILIHPFRVLHYFFSGAEQEGILSHSAISFGCHQ